MKTTDGGVLTLDDLIGSLYAKYEASKNGGTLVTKDEINDLHQRLFNHRHESTKWTIERGKKLLVLLQRHSSEQQKKLEPRSKFKFTQHSQILPSPQQPQSPAEHSTLSLESISSTVPFSHIKNSINETIIFGPKELNGVDVTIENVENCLIVLNDNCAAIRGNYIHNSIIIAPNVESSAILYNLEHSLFMIKSLQLRIHESHSSTFLCSTKSPPVIERSNNIQFGHLPHSLMTSSNDSDGTNDEIDVKDFNWHRQGEKSPNWTTLKIPIQLTFDLTEQIVHVNKKQWKISEQTNNEIRFLFNTLIKRV